jgi:hypothetical protein
VHYGFGNGGAAIELPDVQFTYPVIGKMNKAVEVASNEYSSGDKPGIGNSTFFITFKDNWIKRFYYIRSQGGILAYVHGDPEVVMNGFRYEIQLSAAGPDSFCPVTELDPNTKWVEMFTSVAESESRSTESKMVMPGQFKNQMGFMRAGFSWAGNAANKVMNIMLKGKDGKETNAWMDYAMWQFENAGWKNVSTTTGIANTTV